MKVVLFYKKTSPINQLSKKRGHHLDGIILIVTLLELLQTLYANNKQTS